MTMITPKPQAQSLPVSGMFVQIRIAVIQDTLDLISSLRCITLRPDEKAAGRNSVQSGDRRCLSRSGGSPQKIKVSVLGRYCWLGS